MHESQAHDSEQNKVLERTVGHQVRQLRAGLLQITFYFPAPTNCFLYKDVDGLTLVDSASPWNAAAILAVISSTGVPLRRIVITHAHPDHAGSAAEISKATGAKVFAHAAELPFLEGRQSMADLPGFWMTQAFLKAGKRLGLLDSPPCAQVEPLSAGDFAGSLAVLHTSGHTPGSISLWAEQEQALFSGDNIFNSFGILRFGLPWFTLDLQVQAESLTAYDNLPARLLLTGHGPAFIGDVAGAIRKMR